MIVTVAVGLEADAAHLVHRRRRDLEILADADAAELAAGAALGAPVREAGPVGGRDGAIEERRELARIVGVVGRRPVGHRVRRDVVAAAELDAVDAGLGGGGLDEPLHDVVALGAPGAAIGADRRRVGEDALDRDVDRRRRVDAGQVLGDVDRGRQRHHLREIGAEIAEARDAHGEEAAVLVERERRLERMAAAVVVGHEALGALVGPPHRPAERLRGMEERDIFGIDRRLHAERAADVRRQDAHLLLGDADDVRGDRAAHPEGALRADMDGVPVVCGIVFGDRGARLQGAHDEAVVRELEPRHVGRRREGGVDLGGVAEMVVEDDVRGELVVEERRAGRRRLARVGDRRQFLDLDRHRLGGVARLRRRLGDDAGDRLADIAHAVARQRRMRRLRHRRAVAILELEHRLHRTEPGRREIGAGVDREHARHGAWRSRSRCPGCGRAHTGCGRRRRKPRPRGAHRPSSAPRRARASDPPCGGPAGRCRTSSGKDRRGGSGRS